MELFYQMNLVVRKFILITFKEKMVRLRGNVQLLRNDTLLISPTGCQ